MHRRLTVLAAVWALAVWIVALAAVSPARGAVPAQSPEASAPAPKLVSLSKVVSELLAEAAEARKADYQRFPRETADYAQDKNVTVSQAELLPALGRSHSSDPVADAYVKWQLLSFDPNLSKAHADTLRRVVAAMPELRPHLNARMLAAAAPAGGGPGMNVAARMAAPVRRPFGVVNPIDGFGGVRGGDPTLSRVNSGVSLAVQGTASADRRYLTATSRFLWTDVQQPIRRIEVGRVPNPTTPPVVPVPVPVPLPALAANLPADAARKALIQALPEEGGVRLAAMAADLKARIVAADAAGTWEAIDRLEAYSQAVADSGQTLKLAPSIWSPALADLRWLLTGRNIQVTSLEPDDRGPTRLTGQTVAVPADLMSQIVRNLGLAKEVGVTP